MEPVCIISAPKAFRCWLENFCAGNPLLAGVLSNGCLIAYFLFRKRKSVFFSANAVEFRIVSWEMC